jgi:NAD(P)-dependent dehydrogenase (short-subunit alcohol dehydrogenase family)
MGGLNVLVNNAGIGSLGSVEDESYETFKHVQTVDVDSIFLGCKYAIPMMRDHGLGSIINISSIAGIIASGNYVSYNTAKAAVRHISKSIALHCAKSTGGQIRCNSVHPVFINTPILDRTKEMFGEKKPSPSSAARSRSARSASRTTSPMPCSILPRTSRNSSPASS